MKQWRSLTASMIVLSVLLSSTVDFSFAEEQRIPSTGRSSDAVDSAEARELDKAIQEVINQREYQWRMPREVVEEEQQGLLYDLLQGLMNTAKRIWKPIAELWSKFNRWLRRQFSSSGPSGSGREWTAGEMNLLIIILIAALALLILFFVWKQRKKGTPAEVLVAEPMLATAPDLADENVVADQLPEEGWQRLAQDLLSRGELRLALRAMFMATLAHLAQARLITIAKFKSNREYLVEFYRRAYQRQDLQAAFGQNVEAIDSVWYGMYPVTEDLLQRFRQNTEIMAREAE